MNGKYAAVLLLALLTATALGSTSIRLGHPVSGVTSRRQFYYYKLSYSGSNPLTFSVTSRGGDCDMYIGLGYLPSATRYTYQDSSYKYNFSVTVQRPPSGVYYVGIQGYTGVTHYTLTATASSGQTCNGRGRFYSGRCHCLTGFSGSSCQNRDWPLALGHTTTVRQTRSGLLYFALDVSGANENVVVTSKQSSTNYRDLYMRFDKPPTYSRYDIRTPSSSTHNRTLVQVDPKYTSSAEVLYLAMYCSSSCTYTLTPTVHSTQPCRNDAYCSGHGDCSSSHGRDSCSCHSGYSGTRCNVRTLGMSADTQYSGVASSGNFNYFHYASTHQHTVQASLQEHSSSSGSRCILYARLGSNPSTISYAKRVSGQKSLQLTVDATLGQTWYFGVYSYWQCNYTLSATANAKCSSSNCVHGSCNSDGECICRPPYVGDQCRVTPSVLSNGVYRSSSVRTGSWGYYSISVPRGASSLVVEMLETTTSSPAGSVWLYVREGLAPNMYEYTRAETSSQSKLHYILMPFDQPLRSTQTFYIGVLGSPVLSGFSSQSYKVSAWYSVL